MGFLTGEKPRTKKIDLLDPKQAELWNQFFNQLMGGTTGLTGGDLMKGGEEGQFAQMMNQLLGYGGEGFESSLGGFQDILSKGPEDFEEYYTSVIEQPLLERFTEDIQPSISRGYSPSGFYSSQRLDADQRAEEELVQALAGGRAETGYAARESQLNRALQAAFGLSDVGTRSTQAGLGIGGFGAGLAGEEQRRKENLSQTMLQALGLNRYGLDVKPGSRGFLSELMSSLMRGGEQFLGGLGYGLGSMKGGG